LDSAAIRLHLETNQNHISTTKLNGVTNHLKRATN